MPESTPELTPETPESNPEPTPESATPESNPSEPSFGWTTYAEQLNGRFAMIGIIILLILEFVSQQTFFEWIGWQ
ncbi:high light inducible protein [Roseofilum sp. BLCC_M91]|uniref:High light inducible protein n=2 Tax=Roseofilum TaxID=1233426 RepID=A0ABT7BPN2_9CYAN|nr:high light inducible protein [Roseofilum halophilum BLCC-M91]